MLNALQVVYLIKPCETRETCSQQSDSQMGNVKHPLSIEDVLVLICGLPKRNLLDITY